MTLRGCWEIRQQKATPPRSTHSLPEALAEALAAWLLPHHGVTGRVICGALPCWRLDGTPARGGKRRGGGLQQGYGPRASETETTLIGWVPLWVRL